MTKTHTQTRAYVRVETSTELLTLREIRRAIADGKHVYHVPNFGEPIRLFGANPPHNTIGMRGFDKNGLWYELNKELD